MELPFQLQSLSEIFFSDLVAKHFFFFAFARIICIYIFCLHVKVIFFNQDVWSAYGVWLTYNMAHVWSGQKSTTCPSVATYLKRQGGRTSTEHLQQACHCAARYAEQGRGWRSKPAGSLRPGVWCHMGSIFPVCTMDRRILQCVLASSAFISRSFFLGVHQQILQCVVTERWLSSCVLVSCLCDYTFRVVLIAEE